MNNPVLNGTNVDQNGNRVDKAVRHEKNGSWSANVWWGHGIVTNVDRRFGYKTRQAARKADISDPINGASV